MHVHVNKNQVHMVKGNRKATGLFDKEVNYSSLKRLGAVRKYRVLFSVRKTLVFPRTHPPTPPIRK